MRKVRFELSGSSRVPFSSLRAGDYFTVDEPARIYLCVGRSQSYCLLDGISFGLSPDRLVCPLKGGTITLEV